MSNKFVVGKTFENYYGEKVARIVFANGVWSSEEDKELYLEENDYLPDNDEPILYESTYCEEFVEGDYYIQDFIREHGLIDVEERQRKDQERQHIVDTLAAMGADTANFIVSDGRVYMGYNECEQYIQGTHAWCSSSMSC